MRKICLLLLAVITLTAPATAGGGWPQPLHHGYFKLSQSILRAGQYYSPDGSLLDITTTSIYTTAFYGEYGITHRLTGLIYAPLFVRSTINHKESTINGAVEPGDALNGIGDLECGLKYGIVIQGPIAISASLMLHLPTGQNVGGETELLQTGDGAFSQLLRLDVSHSFYPAPFYATLSAAYNQRGPADYEYSLGTDHVVYSDEFRWGGELGWTPDDNRWLIALKWQQVISMKNGNSGGQTGSSSIFGNNVEYFALMPEVNYTFGGKFGVSASVATAMGGKNILAAPSYNVGVFYIL